MEKTTKILITGANGFVAKNFISFFEKKDVTILKYDVLSTIDDLIKYCLEADLIFHFAAVQRPISPSDYSNNFDLTNTIINILESNNCHTSIFFASSIHANNEQSEYGKIKHLEENKILDYANKNGSKCYIWRFNNLFGRYSKPNYTSVVSTFFYNSIMNLPVQINDFSSELWLSLIDDAINEVWNSIIRNQNYNQINYLNCKYKITLGELAYYVSVFKTNSINSLKGNEELFKKLNIIYQWFKDFYLC